MGASSGRRHWLLAAIVLGLSSSLAASELTQQQLVQRSFVDSSSSSFSSSDARGDETSNRTVVATTAAIRRRRYVRFPTGPTAYVLEGGGPPPRNLGPHPAARFVPQFPGSWRQQKSLWRSPVIADYNRPVMSHRTPRLIFRDNDFLPPAGSGASFFQQSNQLPDFEDDVRGKRSLSLSLSLSFADSRYIFNVSIFCCARNVPSAWLSRVVGPLCRALFLFVLIGGDKFAVQSLYFIFARDLCS